MEGAAGVRFYNVSSTARGGGVAEMMPRQIAQLRGFGITARWLILEGDAAFFSFTKQLHNAVHGTGQLLDAAAGAGERALYARVCEREADALVDGFLAPAGFDAARDVVVLHDPQPLGMLPRLRERLPGLKVVWRAHIGLSPSAGGALAADAWAFFEPHATLADAVIVSSPDYVRPALRDKTIVMRPGISPISHKKCGDWRRAARARAAARASSPRHRAPAARAQPRPRAGRRPLRARARGPAAPPHVA